MKLTTFFVLITISLVSCLDQVEEDPPCFLDGMEDKENSNEISQNICCDEGTEGDTFCRELFSSEGYGTISQLGHCSTKGYCKLCEIGVDCACLSNRDCGSGESCTISDDSNLCSEQLSSSVTTQRCAICI